jgi:hypothetical protein
MAAKTKFKIGDNVRITTNGKSGKILAITDVKGMIAYTIEGSSLMYVERVLELVA